MDIREIRKDSKDLSILEAINEEAIPKIERHACHRGKSLVYRS